MKRKRKRSKRKKLNGTGRGLSKRKLRPKRDELGDMTGGVGGFYMTLQEIADIEGISKERVRQIIYNAMGRIKREHPELKEFIE